jgi:cytochrome b561
MANYRKLVHWALFALTVAYLISGLGITQYQAVELLSFGLFGKALCMRIHESLSYAFVPALFLHVYFKLKKKK